MQSSAGSCCCRGQPMGSVLTCQGAGQPSFPVFLPPCLLHGSQNISLTAAWDAYCHRMVAGRMRSYSTECKSCYFIWLWFVKCIKIQCKIKQTNKPKKTPSLYLLFQENLMSLFHSKSSTFPILHLISNSNKIKFKKKRIWKQIFEVVQISKEHFIYRARNK